MKIEHSIDIAAPVARVWELTVDVESWPDHTPTMTSIRRLDDGPLAVGSRADVKQPGQRARVWTVTEFEPEHRFAWSADALGATMTGTHQLAPADGGTTNTLSVDLEGRLSALIGPLIRRPIARALAKENQGFKAAAEA